MIERISEKIKSLKNEYGEPLFITVDEAVNIASVMSRPLSANVVAHIVLLEESPLDSTIDELSGMQRQRGTIGVLVGIRSAGRAQDTNDELVNIRKKLNEALFGWVPVVGCKPLSKALCNMQKLQDQQLFWMERYSTTYYLESVYDQ